MEQVKLINLFIMKRKIRVDWGEFILGFTFASVCLLFIIGTVVAWYFLFKEEISIGNIVITVLLTIFLPCFGLNFVKYCKIIKEAFY